MAKIFLVEDDMPLALIITQQLKTRLHVVDHLVDGLEAKSYMENSEFDLAILDWLLPGLDGKSLCDDYRKIGGKAPVLLLTGKSTIDNKTEGFKAGADDYITKPFNVKELILRVDALLRRQYSPAPVVIERGEIQLEPGGPRVRKNGKEIRLQPKEYALLEFLMKNPDTVYSADTLLRKVWETNSESTELALRSCISNLRKKLDIIDRNGMIQSIHGKGYRLSTR